MRLTIFNGSPRGKGGNSEVLIQWLSGGIRQNPDAVIDILYMNRLDEQESYISRFQTSDFVLVVFPLYTDCMPGIVMSFIEKLQPLRKSLSGLKLGFVVHSGFPEALQSRAVEKYLVWLAGELGTDYAGTVVMGGSEGTRSLSRSAAAKKKQLFDELGRRLVQEGKFDAALVRKAAGLEKLGKVSAFLFNVIAKTGLTNHYWNSQLKKNNAYHERYAKPYERL